MGFSVIADLILILNKNLYYLSRKIAHNCVGLLDRRQPACVVRLALRNYLLTSN